jgi:hypothetical protein
VSVFSGGVSVFSGGVSTWWSRRVATPKGCVEINRNVRATILQKMADLRNNLARNNVAENAGQAQHSCAQQCC